MDRRILVLAVLPLVAGCSLQPVWPDVEQVAGSAAGLPAAITFETNGQPIDTPGEASTTLTISDVAVMALNSDPRIQAAIARTRRAYAEAWQARLLPNPVLSVALRFPEAGASPIIEAGLAADLLSILQIPGRTSAADGRLRAAAAEAVTVTLDVLADAQGTYAAARSLDALMPVLEERQKLLGKTIEVAEARLKAGEGVRLDVTTLHTQRAELELETAQRQVDRRELRLRLARLIGKPSDAGDWTLEPWPSSPPADHVPEDQWIGSALNHRPELQSRVWELTALGVEARLARWALLEGTEAGVDSEKESAGDWSVGPAISIPLPIFDWGQAKRAAARARVIEARHELTDVKRQVVEDVRRALVAYRASASLLRKAREELLPLAERRRAEAESAFRGGESDVVTFILADQDLQSVRTRVIELERSSSEALIRLQRAVGGSAYFPEMAQAPARLSEPNNPTQKEK